MMDCSESLLHVYCLFQQLAICEGKAIFVMSYHKFLFCSIAKWQMYPTPDLYGYLQPYILEW